MAGINMKCKNCGVSYDEIPFNCRDHAPPKSSLAELRMGLEAIAYEKLLKEQEAEGYPHYWDDIEMEW